MPLWLQPQRQLYCQCACVCVRVSEIQSVRNCLRWWAAGSENHPSLKRPIPRTFPYTIFAQLPTLLFYDKKCRVITMIMITHSDTHAIPDDGRVGNIYNFYYDCSERMIFFWSFFSVKVCQFRRCSLNHLSNHLSTSVLSVFFLKKLSQPLDFIKCLTSILPAIK